MNTTEHLQRIKTKCIQKIEAFEKESPVLDDIYQTTLKQSIAGWKSTIASIDTLFACYPDGNIAARSLNAQRMAEAIIATWPEELL